MTVAEFDIGEPPPGRVSLASSDDNQGSNKLWGWGGRPQISMQWGKTNPLPSPPLSDGITVYGAAEIRDSGTMDSLSLNLRPIYYSFSDHSLKDNFYSSSA